MTSAAFSMSHDSGGDRRISIQRAAGRPSGTATSAAAEAALRQVIEDRRRRHRNGHAPARQPSLVGRAAEGVSDVIQGSIAQLGLPQWAFRVVVLTGVVAVLAISVAPVLFRKGPPCPVHPVSGRMLVGKTPPAGAQILLHPRGEPLPGDALPRATVRADGSFSFSTFGADDGAPAGDYVATVQWFRIGRDGSAGGNAIPPKYASPQKSPLVVTVGPGVNEVPLMQITR